CAGLAASRVAAAAPADLSDAAVAARGLGEYYGPRIRDLRHASRWASRLARLGRAADIDACFLRDTTDMVPVIQAGVVVPGPGVSPPVPAPMQRAGKTP